MADDRFTIAHLNYAAVQRLGTDEDDFATDLPDEDIDVPLHLLPRYQDEDDESVLPTAAHPSYPFGNPYRPSAKDKARNPFSTTRSLATNLPALNFPKGLPASTLQWNDLALDHLLPVDEIIEPAPPVANPNMLEDPAEEAENPPPPPSLQQQQQQQQQENEEEMLRYESPQI